MFKPNLDLMRASGLGWRYGDRWIFRHLDLHLAAGELTAILGPNGCGKSTLLSLLSGTVPPQEGTISHCARGLAVVPQSLSLSLPFSGMDMVLLGRARGVSLFSSPDEADYRAAREALSRVKAFHLASRAFSTLSGGEQQLVLIARALAAECPVMLLDEPTAALDWHHQAHVLDLLRGLADEGLAVAFTTHSPQHALDFADKVMLMISAEKQIVGVPDEVLSEETLSGLYRLTVRRLRDSSGNFSTAIPVFRSSKPDHHAQRQTSF